MNAVLSDILIQNKDVMFDLGNYGMFFNDTETHLDLRTEIYIQKKTENK